MRFVLPPGLCSRSRRRSWLPAAFFIPLPAIFHSLRDFQWMVKAAPFWFLAPWALVPNSFCHPSPPVLFSLLLDFTQGVPSTLLFWVRGQVPVFVLCLCRHPESGLPLRFCCSQFCEDARRWKSVLFLSRWIQGSSFPSSHNAFTMDSWARRKVFSEMSVRL
jgi:hypothetical protein